MATPPPRLSPGWPLPPYGFVPGAFPHPVRDPAGHSHGKPTPWGPPPAPGAPPGEAWGHAFDLFNHGYYWEAHEAFEAWWGASAEGEPRRVLFQALLRLCAAGVKARQGLGAGIHSHATRAARLLESLAPPLLGLDPAALARAAHQLALKAHTFRRAEPLPLAAPVLGLQLVPGRPPAWLEG